MVVVDGEVALTPAGPRLRRPLPRLRLAATAAERDRPSPRARCTAWPTACPRRATWPPPRPTGAGGLLLAGRPAIDAIESLDQHGLLVRLIPEWAAVRNKPQRNAYHTFTVDRHLLETAALAAELTDDVERPDLLLIGTLLHDIGKGFPGDHTDVGMEVVERARAAHGLRRRRRRRAGRPGAPPPAAARHRHPPRPRRPGHHRPGGRRRRRPGHPPPAGRADQGRQPGHRPLGLGSLEGALVADLVERTDALAPTALGRSPGPACPRHGTTPCVASVQASGEPEIKIERPSVIIAAPDRPGLLADVAGTLALNGLTSTRRTPAASGRSRSTPSPSSRPPVGGRRPRPRADLLGVLNGEIDLSAELERRSAAYASARRTWSAHPVIVSVAVDNDASPSRR